MGAMRRPALRTAGLAIAFAAAACVAEPAADAPRGFGTSVQRVLAIDLSRPALAERSRGLGDTGTSVGRLALRVPDQDTWALIAAVPVARTDGLQQSAARLAEFAWRPRWQGAEQLAAAATPRQVANRVTESLAGVPWVLGADRRPLPEIDDLRHRTDPADDREEAGLVERLRRRLRL